MNARTILIAAVLVAWLPAAMSFAEIKTTTDRNEGEAATPAFRFKKVPSPARGDAKAPAKFSIIDGGIDPNSGGIDKLSDGKLPTEYDEPEANFFFDAGTTGGRVVADLGKPIEIRQINTYSWHPNTRGPQLYTLYGSDGADPKFNASPKRGTNPTTAGWKQIAAVDTRPDGGEVGGQYGVSLSDSTGGAIGTYRYLLFDMERTEDADEYGNTFYSEIDIRTDAPTTAPSTAPTTRAAIELRGKFVTIDCSQAPDLKDWAEQTLLPVCELWYPKIVQMLPSDGYVAPERFTIQFRPMRAGTPAATAGTRIMCNIDWFRRNLKGEAAGAVVHEMVHVVQQYGRARRENPNAAQNPGWLVEGIPDYIRWFKYEPEKHGADIRNPDRARFDGSYRVSANFLNWVTDKYDPQIVQKLNASMRAGKYGGDVWKAATGKTVEDLGAEWKAGVQAHATPAVPATRPTKEG
jgi:hypothetical protein